VGIEMAGDAPGLDAPLRHLRPGELLMRQGDPGDEAFEVVSGTLEIVRGTDRTPLDVVGPGQTLGEVAMLAGCRRTATARALEPCVVRVVGRDDFERGMREGDDRWTALAETARARIDGYRLTAMVTELLGVAPDVAGEITAASEWRRVAAGETLFAEGDVSDAAYLVLSGRLAVSTEGEHIREVARGEILGEIGLIERAPRSASVVALRDSTLARFSADAFMALSVSHPTLMLQVSRTVLARLIRRETTGARARSVAVAVTAPIDGRACAAGIAAELARHGSTCHLWSERVDAELGLPGLVESGLATAQPALAEFLQDAETSHDYLLVETDRGISHWTRTALALADRVVVIASAVPDADESERIRALLDAPPAASRIERWLVVVQRPDADRPLASRPLTDRFDVDRVAHVRNGSLADLARVARLVSGTATGLVLGGGGARGFAHLGAWRALHELGIDVDVVGGASIGAPLGLMMALQSTPDALERDVTRLFHGLLDYTVPVVSLLKGERIASNITMAVGDLDLRDTWLPFSCVSTNLTRSRVEVHDRGAAATAVRASVAIPGVLPPVPYHGDLLVDGGVLNNLPCDVVRATGTVGRLIAVDLSPPVGPTADDDFGLSVSGWRALRAQFGSTRARYPGIVATIMRAMVAGSARDRERMIADGTVDYHLDLDLRGVQLLDFERVAEISARGYTAALPRLRQWQADVAAATPTA
jgi:predicted acylesterase/phospholipase RssA/CRP-like cAMP-binding protein